MAQMIWKTKSGSCRQGERRGSCASQSTGCCFDPTMKEQIFACGGVHAEHYIQAMQEEFIRRFKAPAAPERMAGGEEREENGKKYGKTKKAASGHFEGATLGPTVDSARHQDATGESGGGGNLNMPRSGLYARESSRFPRGQRKLMEDYENL